MALPTCLLMARFLVLFDLCLQQHTGRPCESGYLTIIDPKQRAIAMYLYCGMYNSSSLGLTNLILVFFLGGTPNLSFASTINPAP